MLKKFCEVSSCNGVADLYEARSNKYHFIFWAVIMTCMMCASIYFTYVTIHGYITTPSVTNVVMVPAKRLDMPEVLICYNGGMNISAMLAAHFSRELIKVISAKTKIVPMQEMHDELLKYVIAENLTMKEVYRQFSFKCEQMIEKFGVPRGFGDTSKSRCDKAVPIWTDKGICYLFKNNSQQIFPGDGGIEITLKGLPLHDRHIFTGNELLKMKMTHDYSLSMEQSFGQQLSGRSFTVPLNSFVTVSLNPKRYVRLSKFNGCDNRKDTYSSNTCFSKCYTDHFTKICQCQTNEHVNFERYPQLDICYPFTQENCQIDINTVETCQKDCLPKCDEWMYENTISVSTLLDEDVTENSSTYVNIEYDTMQYTKIEEVEAFTMDMAVANVGGQSGLWLGASFVTIIQAIYYLVLAAARKMTNGNIQMPAANK